MGEVGRMTLLGCSQCSFGGALRLLLFLLPQLQMDQTCSTMLGTTYGGSHDVKWKKVEVHNTNSVMSYLPEELVLFTPKSWYG